MAKAAKKPAIRPLGEKVLVKRLEAETMTAGGIVLPESAKEKPAQGTILALGDGPQLADGTRGDFQVKIGDTVMFTSYAGTEVKLEGETYMLMEESDILAILG